MRASMLQGRAHRDIQASGALRNNNMEPADFPILGDEGVAAEFLRLSASAPML